MFFVVSIPSPLLRRFFFNHKEHGDQKGLSTGIVFVKSDNL